MQVVEALIQAGAYVNIVSYYQTSYKLCKLMFICSYDNNDRMILKDKILFFSLMTTFLLSFTKALLSTFYRKFD